MKIEDAFIKFRDDLKEWVTNNLNAVGGTNFDMIYPVGSIYMSVNNVSPSNLFGGTWEQIKDRFLLSAGDTYEAGATGGEATHKLTVDEMPSHGHSVRVDWTDIEAIRKKNTVVVNGSTAVTANTSGTVAGSMGIDRGTDCKSTGGSQAHNNMPPYLTVYVWKRTS